MRMRKIMIWLTLPALAFGAFVVAPAPVLAHCDGLDGPVVRAAQRALDARNPSLALMWVRPQDEPEIRALFEQTLAVRALSPQAKELADRLFFEALVRVHRAGEGAAFTGLKPAGRDLGPAIPAADAAVSGGSVAPVLELLTATMQERLREHFRKVAAAKAFAVDDVAAGREYVTAYVEFIHYVERVYEASVASVDGHFGETEPAARPRTNDVSAVANTPRRSGVER